MYDEATLIALIVMVIRIEMRLKRLEGLINGR